MIWLKRIILLAIVLLIGGAIVAAFLPEPVRVDVETVREGTMEVVVRDDGHTRLRERYVVSTPISGRLRRIDLEVGDNVLAGETVVARLEPTAPTLLDPRELARSRARVRAAEARMRRVETDLAKAQIDLKQARNDLDRIETLAARKVATASELEKAMLNTRLKTEELNAAEFAQEIAQYELELEQAALLHVEREAQSPGDASNDSSAHDFEIASPITGRVLQVIQESSAVLAAGSELLELGDPDDLEVVVDVLSSDAVRIRPGQRAYFEHWGGQERLTGSVRLVEPSGFLKISALGVEEQRVNVIIDFTGPREERTMLGDGYRVEARIVVWEDDDTLSVPTGALFRSGDDWAVFVVKNSTAALRRVEVGENNGLRAQVLSGLTSGEQVILHPSDQIADGVTIKTRSP